MDSNEFARKLKALHIPGSPVIFANVWDPVSAHAVLSLNTTSDSPVQAIATASWAFAACLGKKDEELTLSDNLDAIRRIASSVQKAGLPLSVDLQDGYGTEIATAVKEAVRAGAHGANIEDSIPAAGAGKGIQGSLYDKEEQVGRVKRALEVAQDCGCPDFVLNARCDVFVLSETKGLTDEVRMSEAIARGKAYLEAGATTIFFWGGPRGLRDAEVETLVRELDGKIAVKLGSDETALSTKELAKMGVARISVGPSLLKIAVEAVKKSALNVLQGGRLSD